MSAAAAAVVAVLLAAASAVADTPPTTTTDPVTTVSTLPAPPPVTTKAPRPDAAPVHKKTAPVHHTKPAVHPPVTRPAPRPTYTPPQQHAAPAKTTHVAKKPVVHPHSTTHPAPAKPSTPATVAHHLAPMPVQHNTPAAAHASAASWKKPAAFAGIVVLLALAGVVAVVRGRRGPSAAVAPAAPAPSGTAWISLWRGYVRSGFVAYAANGDGHPTLIAQSPLFTSRSGKAPREKSAARKAHTALVETLARLGWEEDGPGETWFGDRFRRADHVV